MSSEARLSALPRPVGGRERAARAEQRPRPRALSLAGVAMLAVLAGLALGAPLLAPHDPIAQDLANVLAPPSLGHPFGTDYLGRDILSRLIWGARMSLGTVAVATGASVALGVAIGLIAGASRAWLDELTMRTADLFLMVPSLVLALALAGVRGPGIENVLIALVAGGWPAHARQVRSVVLTVRAQPYVEAAVALGASRPRLLLRHLAPAAVGPTLVLASLEAGHALLHVAALSFLGAGIQPPSPEWGTMLADAQQYYLLAPHLILFPGLAVLLATLSFNLLAEQFAGRFSRFAPRL